MHAAFEDDDAIFLVLEHCAKGDLFNYLRHRGKALTEGQVGGCTFLCYSAANAFKPQHLLGVVGFLGLMTLVSHRQSGVLSTLVDLNPIAARPCKVLTGSPLSVWELLLSANAHTNAVFAGQII
jgi:hypothetical protein